MKGRPRSQDSIDTLEISDTLPSTGVEQGPPSSRSAPGAKVGRVIAGRYKLERRLGAGGMGEVYRAEHLTLGTPIALKLMHARLAADPDLSRRFQREARATSTLNHPNVVRVIDFGVDEGTHFLAMEYLDGESLETWLQRADDPPPLVEVAQVMAQVLDALEVAHAAGIVHRDLKPDNIFLRTEPDGRRGVKVVDFGLAHFDDERDRGGTLTKADMVAGTPQYMSPEQCHSLAVGPSSDLYAMGCVLTDMLQLRPPFMGSAAIEIITQQLFMPPPPLARDEGAEPVPPLLEKLRLDLLAKTPAGRPKSAAEVKARLREAMSPELTAARLPARKGDVPLGGRAERAPVWTAPPQQEATVTPPAQVDVGLARLARGATGVSSSCVTGLAAQGVLLREPATGAAVIVLDAGADLDAARAEVTRLCALVPAPKVIVCLDDVSVERMNALIAAGAADLVAYPVSADDLGRKVHRVLRRKR